MPGRGWDEFNAAKVRLSEVQVYQQAVRAETDAYLDKLTDEELDRQVYLFSRQCPVADVLTMLVVHSSFHVGEIATIKGIQGTKGLPF